MGTFLVEGYLAAGTTERLREFHTAASRASQDMARDGVSVALHAGFRQAQRTSQAVRARRKFIRQADAASRRFA